MDLGVIGFQLQSLVVSFLSARVILFAVPGDTKVVVAGRQLRTLFDGLLKEIQSFIQLLLLQCFHTLKDKQLRLREARAKFVQCGQFVKFLMRRCGISLRAESNA